MSGPPLTYHEGLNDSIDFLIGILQECRSKRIDIYELGSLIRSKEMLERLFKEKEIKEEDIDLDIMEEEFDEIESSLQEMQNCLNSLSLEVQDIKSKFKLLSQQKQK